MPESDRNLGRLACALLSLDNRDAAGNLAAGASADELHAIQRAR